MPQSNINHEPLFAGVLGIGWGGEGYAFLDLGNNDKWSDVLVSVTSNSPAAASPEIIELLFGIRKEVTTFLDVINSIGRS